MQPVSPACSAAALLDRAGGIEAHQWSCQSQRSLNLRGGLASRRTHRGVDRREAFGGSRPTRLRVNTSAASTTQSSMHTRAPFGCRVCVLPERLTEERGELLALARAATEVGALLFDPIAVEGEGAQACLRPRSVPNSLASFHTVGDRLELRRAPDGARCFRIIRRWRSRR